MAITWVYMLGIFHMCTHWHTHTYCLAVALAEAFAAAMQKWIEEVHRLPATSCPMASPKSVQSMVWHVSMTGADPVPQGIPWAFLDAKRKCLGECQAQWRGIFLQNCGAPMTHTHTYIYIMGYNCIAISGKKLFWHSVWHSFWRSGPGVPTAPIWRWGPAGDIDMVFGRRIRSWRYGA